MVFQCTHCSYCCSQPSTQIALTLGDISRMSSLVKKSALELYKENLIGFFPFGDPKKPYLFEIDLGLNQPCRFHVQKCSIYSARPINCRLFPYWIYAQAPKEALSKIFDKDMPSYTYHVTSFRKEDKEIYEKYVSALKPIFLEESRKTDKIVKILHETKIDLRKTAPILYQEIESSALSPRQKDIRKIQFCIHLISRKDRSDEFKVIQENIENGDFASIADLEKIEDILNN